jgi:hypothetical protein
MFAFLLVIVSFPVYEALKLWVHVIKREYLTKLTAGQQLGLIMIPAY